MSPAIATVLSHAVVVVLGLLALAAACWVISVLFERVVEPLFMTPDEIAERDKRRLQERASRCLARRPQQREPTPLHSIKFFNND